MSSWPGSARAAAERRGLNQEAIRLLEMDLEAPAPSFDEARQAFVDRHGPSPFDDAEFEGTFSGLRSSEGGRPSPFEADGTP